VLLKSNWLIGVSKKAWFISICPDPFNDVSFETSLLAL
jgi:hypothetical protein